VTWSGSCGVGGRNGGSTSVCPGDMLFTRFALANYSTGSLSLKVSLYLSKDEFLNLPDTGSPAVESVSLDAESSRTLDYPPTVPWVTPGTYQPIIHLTGYHDDGHGNIDPASYVDDWIPLRGGPITVRSC
jgi:hypothetical protein